MKYSYLWPSLCLLNNLVKIGKKTVKVKYIYFKFSVNRDSHNYQISFLSADMILFNFVEVVAKITRLYFRDKLPQNRKKRREKKKNRESKKRMKKAGEEDREKGGERKKKKRKKERIKV